MPLRPIHPHQLSMIESADSKLAFIMQDLRDAGAPKSAAAVALARKSVQGAMRHAKRRLAINK